MKAISRRNLLLSAAAGGLLSGCAGEPPAGTPTVEPKAAFPEKLGVQLYTVRSVLPEKPEDVLRRIAAIGYPIQQTAGDPAQAASAGTASLNAVLDKAASHGLNWIVIPYLSAEQRGTTLDYYRKLAERIEQAAVEARKRGIGLAYHNHAFEFEPMEGSSPFDVMAEVWKGGQAMWELDVFWVSVAGRDPVETLRQQTGRVALVHLKDKAPDLPAQYNEKVPPATFREAGNGSLDFAAILAAGRETGVKHYFVEQDQTPGDPVASLEQSYRHLRSLSVPA